MNIDAQAVLVFFMQLVLCCAFGLPCGDTTKATTCVCADSQC